MSLKICRISPASQPQIPFDFAQGRLFDFVWPKTGQTSLRMTLSIYGANF